MLSNREIGLGILSANHTPKSLRKPLNVDYKFIRKKETSSFRERDQKFQIKIDHFKKMKRREKMKKALHSKRFIHSSIDEETRAKMTSKRLEDKGRMLIILLDKVYRQRINLLSNSLYTLIKLSNGYYNDISYKKSCHEQEHEPETSSCIKIEKEGIRRRRIKSGM